MLATRRSRVRAAAWCLLLIAFLVAAWLKATENRRQLAQAADAARRQQAFQQECQDAYRELRDKLNPPQRGEARSLHEVEQLLPDRPSLKLDSKENGRVNETTWVHPLSGVSWVFWFDADDRLIGWRGSAGPVSTRVAPVPAVSRRFVPELLREVGRVIILHGKWAWAVVFALFLAARRWRGVTADLLLAVALACVVADAFKVNYTLADVFSNDALYVDTLMVAVSVAILAATSPRIGPVVGAWLVPQRFSVRWLMGFTALVAILVSFGRHGLVIGSVLAVAAGTYWAFRPRYRRMTGRRESPSAVT